MAATQAADPATAPPRSGLVEQHRRLPRLALPGLFALGAVAGVAVSALTGFHIVLAVIYALVLGALAVYVVSRVVEGARKACPIGFGEYLKVGVPVTLLTLAAGVVLMR